MIYFKYLKMIFLSLSQYRGSTWLLLIGQFFNTLFSFLSMALLFDRFGSIHGWTLAEAALCFAVVNLSLSVSECFARGFDRFSGMIVKGDFDRILLRPRGPVVQILGSAFELTKLGGVLQSAAVLALALGLLDHSLSLWQAFTVFFMVLSGICIFTGIFILGATVCFFTVQGLEIINIFTYGGREMAQYPLNIYPRWVIRFFTFIIPFGCMNYLPLLYVTGRLGPGGSYYIFTPLYGLLFILPCLLIFRLGMKHYLSTGS